MVSKPQQEFLLGALIGGAIAAATTLMLTPFSGAAMRRQVANGFDHLNGTAPAHPAPKKRKAAVRKSTVKASANTHTPKPKKTPLKKKPRSGGKEGSHHLGSP